MLQRTVHAPVLASGATGVAGAAAAARVALGAAVATVVAVADLGAAVDVVATGAPVADDDGGDTLVTVGVELAASAVDGDGSEAASTGPIVLPSHVSRPGLVATRASALTPPMSRKKSRRLVVPATGRPSARAATGAAVLKMDRLLT